MFIYHLCIYTDLYWKNPQFSVTLRDVDDADNKPTCTVIISLIEKEQNNKSQIAIGFDVYKVQGFTIICLSFVCFVAVVVVSCEDYYFTYLYLSKPKVTHYQLPEMRQ